MCLKCTALPIANSLSTPPPPLVFHYQVKMHIFSKTQQSFTEQPMKISLYGSHGEKENIDFVLCVHNKWTDDIEPFGKFNQIQKK